MVSARDYLRSDLEALFGLAGGMCSFDECRERIIDSHEIPERPIIHGQIGHIIAASDNGPRGDPHMTADERRRYNNLILVCPKHHKIIDTIDEKYPAPLLRSYKATHEVWVQRQTQEAMDQFTDVELEVACKAIEGSTVLGSTSLRAVPPSEKMAHNALGSTSEQYLTIGMLRSDDVALYLERHTTFLDEHFPGRLRASFVREYETYREKGLHGDALFLALASFAGGGTPSSVPFTRWAAGLAVLTHLFRICDVFEEPPRADA